MEKIRQDKFDAWHWLRDKNIDTERERQLELDAKDVRNEMALQMYHWEGMTCKEIGEFFGLDESTIYRIVCNRQPVPDDDLEECDICGKPADSEEDAGLCQSCYDYLNIDVEE